MNRRSFLVPVFIVLLAVAGFAQTISFMVAGVTRTYNLHVPSSGLSNPPLVFILHGHGMDGTSQESSCQMYPIADSEKFIVVYPNAISGNWDQSDTSHDFAFVLAIIDSINAKYHIDMNRVYIAGFSQGAAMCHSFGCKYSDIFAAIAPVSGCLSGTCSLKRPVPVFMTFGTNDIFPLDTFMKSVTTWVKLDSCPTIPIVTRPYPPSNPKSVVTRLTYGPGKYGVEVIADSIYGGTHEWPMDTVTNLNTSKAVWAFFKQFSLTGATTVRQPTVSVAHESISASYSSGIVHLQGVAENSRVLAIDTKGRLISRASVTQRQFAFKNKPSGVYMLIVSGNCRPIAIKMVIP